MEKNTSIKLHQLYGLHTAETAATALGITRQSAINLLSRLKKGGYVTVTGGGRQKRLYKVTMRKQLPRVPGMFDIINRYSHMKLNPWYDHQVHGKYTPEDALIDAIETGSFRAILASLRLYSHITDWPHLYRTASKKGIWQKVGALYDLARVYIRVRKMPAHMRKEMPGSWVQLTQLGDRNNFKGLQQAWHVYIPFNQKDMEAVL